MKRNKKKEPWSEQEVAVLSQLHPLISSKKWKKISDQLRKKGFTRSQIEIRERWVNFEDPSLNKAQWQEQQLEKLYDIHDQVGTKWCVIQKYLGRTQNMIKNRFYGTLRNLIRYLVNHFGPRKESFNSTISKLSPKILNEIYKGEHQFKFIGDEVKDVIYSMRFKIDKKKLSERFKVRKDIYAKLKGIVCKFFRELKKGRNPDISSESEQILEKVENKNFEQEEEEQDEDEDNEVKQEAEECSSEQESKVSGAGLVKAESVDEIYPFLEQQAKDMKFKVEEPVYYPFYGYCGFEGMGHLYRPPTTNSEFD